ncbi:MAG: DUF3014 domain-containing protein [Betaproteobacteria bacterium]|nr:DUF3014 domain-containing protein [Betaproteobacteria bacterium]
MKRIVWWLIAFAGLGLIGLIIYNAMRSPEQPVVAQPALTTEASPPAPPAEPEIRHPVPGMPPEKPLPALDTSDTTMRNVLAELLADKALIELPVLAEFVRRVVATIDNLPRRQVAPRLWPLKRAPGRFAISGDNENATIAAVNAGRYAIYVRLAEALDSGKLAALYFHYYPLFQQAYRDLGYPKGHFNDRLVEVIDHLLAAPELQGPVALVRPKVFYLYADPDLESRSAGQKILMRMGAANAVRIKAKLREIRGEIADRSASLSKSK